MSTLLDYFNSKNMSSAHRSKRSMSWENNVEVMVVADKKMAAYHGKELQHYVLTLMAIVSIRLLFLCKISF